MYPEIDEPGPLEFGHLHPEPARPKRPLTRRMNDLQATSKLHPVTAAMRSTMQDLRFAGRLFYGAPRFAAIAVLMLGLGMAAATTVFSWIDGLLLQPYRGAARGNELAVLEMSIPSAPNGGTSISWLDYRDFRDQLTSASGLAAH